MISKFLTMPLDVIKKRFQVSGFEIPHHLHVAERNTQTTTHATTDPLTHAAATHSSQLPPTATQLRESHVPRESAYGRGANTLMHQPPGVFGVANGRVDTPLSNAPHQHSTTHLPTAHMYSLTPPSLPLKQGPVPAAAVAAAVSLPPVTSIPSSAPLISRRRRRHDQPVTGRRPFTGVLDCARGIVSHEGIAGLFKGSVPSLLKAGPNSAIIYMVYEYAIRWLNGETPTVCVTTTIRQNGNGNNGNDANAHKYKE